MLPQKCIETLEAKERMQGERDEIAAVTDSTTTPPPPPLHQHKVVLWRRTSTPRIWLRHESIFGSRIWGHGAMGRHAGAGGAAPIVCQIRPARNRCKMCAVCFTQACGVPSVPHALHLAAMESSQSAQGVIFVFTLFVSTDDWSPNDHAKHALTYLCRRANPCKLQEK